MINYVIIENEEKYQKIYQDTIKKIMNNSLNYKIDTFSRLSEGLKNIINNNDIYKIYLIDIHLGCKYTGIDIAKQIRRIDNESEILFISAQEVMFETVFKTIPKVYTFIYKYSHLKEKLYQELYTIVTMYKNKSKYINLDKKKDIRILISEILYIYRETAERKIYVVTKDNKYPICLSIKDINDIYKNTFIQVHRACLVNPQNVSLYNFQDGYFIVKGNKVFMCSKNYKHCLEQLK